MHRKMLIPLCLALLGVASGCSNLTLRNAQDAYRAGDIAEAEAQIRTFAQNEGNGVDRVIAYLELGNMLRARGAGPSSNEAFLVADAAIDAIDEQPEVQLSKEGLAALTNLNALPYRGYNYDRVMLSTYRALNFMEMGEVDEARVELRRAYLRQTEAVQRNAKRIEKMHEASQYAKEGDKNAKRPGYDVAKAQQDAHFQEGLEEHYSDLDRYTAYADYVNPFTEFLQGIYFMAAAADGDDIERARVSMRRVAGMVPNNHYLKEDLAMAQRIAQGGPVEPVTYVIFETGTAPKRGQIRIDIPLFLVTREVDYVGANFPRLIMNDDFLPVLEAHVGADSYPTYLLADMDGIIAQEFKNELPIVITKTLISAGTKAAIAYGLKEATKKTDPWVALGTRIATTVYQAGANEADLRTWATLPKQIAYARFPTPRGGVVQIRGYGHPTLEVKVDTDAVNVIMVRSINSSAPLQVSQFTMKGGKSWATASAQ